MVAIYPEKALFSEIRHKKVVAAIPCFNTQEHIEQVVAGTRRFVDQVIVIDDGSTDMTADVAELAGARVIKHKANLGYGEAVKSCFAAARADRADVLIIIDGDGQHNPDEIPPVLRPILDEEADLVIGSRFLQSRDKVPAYRRFGINMINGLWNFGSKNRVSDSQSGFRAYNRKVINEMEFTQRGMGLSVEILEQSREANDRIKEVPIICSYENNNSSLSLKAFTHGFSVVLSVLRVRLKSHHDLKNTPEVIAVLGSAATIVVLTLVLFFIN
jgi:glycosyltransferase involved in cell wall biosynthesis